MEADQERLPALAKRSVVAAMLAVGAVLTIASPAYGYHRDELYFRMLHPAWGYTDQPPLTPLIARFFAAVIADRPWAIRIPATAATMASVLVIALITRELGGGRGAQTLAAWAYGFASIPLLMGHVLLTSTIDLPVWPLVLLLVIRAQLRQQPGWWLAAGLVVGVSVYNKLLVAVLLLALVGGIALVGPRRLLWSKWVAAGAGLAVLVGLPNLLYQATHGWPQLSMGRALADNNSGEVRIVMWPFLLVILGPPLVPIWVAGLVALARRPRWRPVRFIAAAFPVLLVLVFVMGAQSYYPFGLVAVLFAIGCVPAYEWIARSYRSRRAIVVAAVALNTAVSGVLGLPLIPLSSLGGTPVPGINQVAADSVGWPAYVHEIADVYASLPASDQAKSVVYTSNYGEAGAVDRYGSRYSLPGVYSGHNQLGFGAAPHPSDTVAIVVGAQAARAGRLFQSCTDAGRLDNLVGVDNEEQGQRISVCRDPVGGWQAIWPKLRHKD
ncbi:MAG: glycosyltransferase family 39 protein [Actinomycetota bacterium]